MAVSCVLTGLHSWPATPIPSRTCSSVLSASRGMSAMRVLAAAVEASSVLTLMGSCLVESYVSRTDSTPALHAVSLNLGARHSGQAI